MDKIEFDLIKLKQSCNVDVRNAVKAFNSYEEYFQGLNKFIEEFKFFLGEYTAEMILSSKSEYKNFRNDIKRIRIYIRSLGITSPLQSLNMLEYESSCGDKKSLTRWINEFHAELADIANNIASAQIVSEHTSNDEEISANIEKPLILATDDKPELLTVVVEMLEDRFKVMAATNARAALRLMEKHPPELFLLDIEMPGMDGYELAENIRSRPEFKETPIIFLTSKNTRQDVLFAIERGGNDYLVKPVKKDLLRSKVFYHLGII